jgi:hypothetical protein
MLLFYIKKVDIMLVVDINSIKKFLQGVNSSQSLKPLDQHERRILNLGIQALRLSHVSTDLQSSWGLIKSKISLNPNLGHSHWMVRIWKGFLNLIGWRISSASLFASIRSMPTQLTNFPEPIFSDKDVNAALKKIYSFESTIGHL